MIERLMDAAARQTGIDRVELRRRNMIQPGADAVHERDGQDLRHRPVRDGDGPGARARRLERVRRARRASRSAAAGCAGAASRRSSNGPAPTCSTETRHGDGERRRRDRDLLGDAGDGAGPRDDVRAARRRRVRRADREDPHRATATPIAAPDSAAPARARCSSAGRRSTSRRSAPSTRRRTSRRRSSKRRRPTSSTATACSASPAPIARSACSSSRDKQPDGASCSTRPARSPMRRGRTAATSAKSRSIRTPARSRSTATGRSTTSAASSIR